MGDRLSLTADDGLLEETTELLHVPDPNRFQSSQTVRAGVCRWGDADGLRHPRLYRPAVSS